MQIVVFGAGGKTGRFVVRKALSAGHAVTVFMRDDDALEPGVRVVTGDAGDAEAVRRAVVGQDAVIDTIGGRTPYLQTDLETSAARNIIDGMRGEGPKRLIVVSALGVNDSIDQTPFWYEHLLIPTFLRGSTKDKGRMEDEVETSGIDFVIVRPSMLTDEAETGTVRIVSGNSKAHKITRSDLAQFLVDQLETEEHVGQSVVITNT